MTAGVRLLSVGTGIVLCCLSALLLTSLIPIISAHAGGANRLYDSVEHIPYRRVGLLLGTSRHRANGAVNPYYYARLRAAAVLYAHNKIDIIIASGDNQFASYNEPQIMSSTLLALGVDGNDIILDYAGFRTFDSVVRVSAVFGITDYTIITQPPHSMRALYIAEQFGYRPIVYNADLPDDGSRFYFYVRETLARVKAFLDIHVLHTEPRYLGPAI